MLFLHYLKQKLHMIEYHGLGHIGSCNFFVIHVHVYLNTIYSITAYSGNLNTCSSLLAYTL